MIERIKMAQSKIKGNIKIIISWMLVIMQSKQSVKQYGWNCSGVTTSIFCRKLLKPCHRTDAFFTNVLFTQFTFIELIHSWNRNTLSILKFDCSKLQNAIEVVLIFMDKCIVTLALFSFLMSSKSFSKQMFWYSWHS